jgi:hypothetical protein
VTSAGGTGQHATVATGFASPLVALVTDHYGNPVPAVAVTFSAPATGATATLSASAPSTGTDGRASVDATASIASGSYDVTASAAGMSTTFPLFNEAGAAASISVVSGSGQSATVDAGFGAPLVAMVHDAYGNPVPGVTVTFTAPVTGPTAALSAPAPTGTDGRTEVTAIAGTAAGGFSISATIPGLASPAVFALTSTAGAPTSVTVVGGSGQSAAVDVAFAQPLEVAVADVHGNPVPGVTVTFAPPGGEPTCVLSTAAATGATGRTQVGATAGTKVGTYTVSASVAGVVTPASFGLENTVGPVASITVVSGSGQTAVVDAPFGAPLEVSVEDVHHNPVPGKLVTFTAPAAEPTATPRVTTATTGAGGYASVGLTAGTKTGGYTVSATVAQLLGSADFTLTNAAGAPASITEAGGSPQSIKIGTPFPAALAAVVRDVHQNPVPGITVTFAAPDAGASASLSAAAPTGADGRTSVTATANGVSGAYSVSATVPGVATGASWVLSNLAGVPGAITVVGGAPQSVAVGGDFAPLVVRVDDTLGDPLAGVVVFFEAPGSGATATLGGAALTGAEGRTQVTARAGTVSGDFTVTARVEGLGSPATFGLTNLAGPAATVTVVTGTPQSASAGAAFATALEVLVEDAYHNPAPSVTVTFAAPGSGASATFAPAAPATSASGHASTVATAGSLAGAYSVTASVPGVSAAAIFALTNLCVLDAACGAAAWCNTAACVPLLANDAAIPVVAAHVPPLAGICVAGAGAVCKSKACDPADDRCGFANGDGPCTADTASVCRSAVCDGDGACGWANGHGSCDAGTAGVVCRSVACSRTGVCIPAGGCALDADCGPAEWCEPAALACRSKLANGVALPSVPGHAPVLDGRCTAAAAAAICASGVCDADDACGYAAGRGPCTTATGALVCRSSLCSATGVCLDPVTCLADADCDHAAQYCDTGSHACAARLPNGAAIPVVGGHDPVVAGTCTAAAAQVVCLSGVCDPDGRCGHANGQGPCDLTTAGSVCRSATCSPVAGICIPAGGCGADADCGAQSWCDTSSFTCHDKLANGSPLPIAGGHTPPLDGVCTPSAGLAVCSTGVCDADGACGYASGHGPCSTDHAAVCRSGVCSATGVCLDPGTCLVDAECDQATQYCDTGAGLCAARLENGERLPVVRGHTPALDGSCSPEAAAVVCQSGVCDPADGRCGLVIGSGPCAADRPEMCRSGVCAATGVCVECQRDLQCGAARPVCDVAAAGCVQCRPGDDAACEGATPVCEAMTSNCAGCDGDLGAGTPRACDSSTAPWCALAGPGQGACGRCTTSAQCDGHPAGPYCDTTSGACTSQCQGDADCGPTAFCSAGGACTPKLDNGQALPVGMTCGAGVGERVCASGACDTDGACGLRNGSGTCDDGTVCRSGACDAKDHACGLLPGDGTCARDEQCRSTRCDASGTCATACGSDDQCAAGQFCDAGSCGAAQPNGHTCDRPRQCASGACTTGRCETPVQRETSTPSGGCVAVAPGVGPNALLLALAALLRRRRRR